MAYPFIASSVPPLVRSTTSPLSSAGSSITDSPLIDPSILPGSGSKTTGSARTKPGVFNAGFRTGLAATLLSNTILDTEEKADEGSIKRKEQKLRVHPLLNADYGYNADAAGLGFGKKHKCHYKYLSHWTTGDKEGGDGEGIGYNDDSRNNNNNMNNNTNINESIIKYRSKGDRGFTMEASALGYGCSHRSYYSYLSAQRADDVLKHYPNEDAVLKFRNYYSD